MREMVFGSVDMSQLHVMDAFCVQPNIVPNGYDYGGTTLIK